MVTVSLLVVLGDVFDVDIYLTYMSKEGCSYKRFYKLTMMCW